VMNQILLSVIAPPDEFEKVIARPKWHATALRESPC
jgi:hypothetical protein